MSPCVPLHGLLTSEHNLYWTSFVFLDIASKDMYIKSLVDSQISICPSIQIIIIIQKQIKYVLPLKPVILTIIFGLFAEKAQVSTHTRLFKKKIIQIVLIPYFSLLMSYCNDLPKIISVTHKKSHRMNRIYFSIIYTYDTAKIVGLCLPSTTCIYPLSSYYTA